MPVPIKKSVAYSQRFGDPGVRHHPAREEHDQQAVQGQHEVGNREIQNAENRLATG
jgi:hypothetical protein